MPPDSTQNLNAKLSAQPSGKRSQGGVGISWRAMPIRNSAPPVRIVGAHSSYQGGYRVNV
jgi:hypothetical protein